MNKHIQPTGGAAMPPLSKLAYTYPEASAATGISRRKIEELVSLGKLPVSYAAGTRPVILADSLYHFLKGGEVVKNG